MKTFHLAGGAALLACCWALGQPGRGASPAKAPGRGAPGLVFLAGGRPVLVRLNVFVDGRPLGDAWDAFMAKLFKHLDVNGDGFLDAREAGRAPPVGALFNANAFYGGYAPPTLAAMDANRDGKVSRA